MGEGLHISKQTLVVAFSALIGGIMFGRITAGVGSHRWDSAFSLTPFDSHSVECGGQSAAVYTGGEEVAINHVASTKQPIKKRVLVGKGVLPHLAHFSTVAIGPGQSFPKHKHQKGFHEVFYVTGGEGTITVEGVPHAVKEGSLIHIPPGVMHDGSVSSKPGPRMTMAYFGVFGCGYNEAGGGVSQPTTAPHPRPTAGG